MDKGATARRADRRESPKECLVATAHPGPLLDLREAAAFAAMHPDSVRRAVGRGELRAMRTGRGPNARLRFTHAMILRWRSANAVRA